MAASFPVRVIRYMAGLDLSDKIQCRTCTFYNQAAEICKLGEVEPCLLWKGIK